MTVVLKSRCDFHLENARRVGIDGENVEIATEAKTRMTAARQSFMAYLESDRTRFIYGTTSGAGQLANQTVPPAEQPKRAQEGRQTLAGTGPHSSCGIHSDSRLVDSFSTLFGYTVDWLFLAKNGAMHGLSKRFEV